MTVRITSEKKKKSFLVFLEIISRQSNLFLLASFFCKLKAYARERQLQTHLKRCAALLKHQTVKKSVIVYFIRWLSITQRQRNIRSGCCEPAKIVVLRRNQDYIDLSLRYFSRWHLWIYRLLQRKQKKVAFLCSKTYEKMYSSFFFKWQRFVLLRHREQLQTDSFDTMEYCGKLSGHITNLEIELKQKENIIGDLKISEQTIKAENAEQKRRINELCQLVKNASEIIGDCSSTSDNKVYIMNNCRESMAQSMEDVTLRLLTDCKNISKAIERLCGVLPVKVPRSKGLGAVIDALFHKATDVCGEIQRLREEEHCSGNMVIFLREIVKGVTSRLVALGTDTSDTKEFITVTSMSERYQDFIKESDAFGLLRNRSADEKGSSTAHVLQLLGDAIMNLQKTIEKHAGFYAVQKETASYEEKRKNMLAGAARNVIAAMRSWSTRSASYALSDACDEQLAEDLQRESEVVLSGFVHLKNLLSNDAPGGNVSTLPLSNITTLDDLVCCVQALKERVKKLTSVYVETLQELCSRVPDFGQLFSSCSGAHDDTFSMSPADTNNDLVLGPDVVAFAVRNYVCNKHTEMKELCVLMQRCVWALGGADDSFETSDKNELIVGHTAIMERLVLLCRDTSDAIEDARKLLRVPSRENIKFKLSELIPKIREKVVELETICAESAAIVQDMHSTSNGKFVECGDSAFQFLAPSVELTKLAMMTKSNSFASVRSALDNTDLILSNLSEVRPAELLRHLGDELRHKSGEMRDLLEGCKNIVSILSGFCGENGGSSLRKEMILPLFAAQSEKLRQTLQKVKETLADEKISEGGVEHYLLELASRLKLTFAENAELKKKVALSEMQAANAMSELEKEISCMNSVRESLQVRVNSLEEQLESRSKLRRLRMEGSMELLRIRTVRNHILKRLMAWLVWVCVVDCKKKSDAFREQKRLLANVVNKQAQQNLLLRQLATILCALPGAATADLDVLGIERLLMRHVHENEGATLEIFLRERTNAAREWMRSTLLSVASLRGELTALRQSVATAWSEGLRETCGRLLTDAFATFDDFNKQRKIELELLQTAALEKAVLARENDEMVSQVAKIREQLARWQNYVSMQDNEIIKLRRKNRDLQLSGVIHGNTQDPDTPPQLLPSSTLPSLSTDVATFSVNELQNKLAIITGARQLAVEAITAMAGKDMAVCIGEVAELTLEFYRRTIAALEDISNTQQLSSDLLATTTIARLQELRNLYGVRDEIVARLPMLFRMPFVD